MDDFEFFEHRPNQGVLELSTVGDLLRLGIGNTYAAVELGVHHDVHEPVERTAQDSTAVFSVVRGQIASTSKETDSERCSRDYHCFSSVCALSKSPKNFISAEGR